MKGVFDGVEELDELVAADIIEADRVGQGWDKVQINRGSLWRWWFLRPVGRLSSITAGVNGGVVVVVVADADLECCTGWT